MTLLLRYRIQFFLGKERIHVRATCVCVCKHFCGHMHICTEILACVYASLNAHMHVHCVHTCMVATTHSGASACSHVCAHAAHTRIRRINMHLCMHKRGVNTMLPNAMSTLDFADGYICAQTCACPYQHVCGSMYAHIAYTCMYA